MSKKWIHLALSGLFFLFALVQYNDPDPVLWILIYGSVGLIALLKVYLPQINFRPLISTFVVLFLLYGLTLIPSFIAFLGHEDKMDLVDQMKATKPWIEDTRELGGLLIAVVSCVYLRNTSISSKKS